MEDDSTLASVPQCKQAQNAQVPATQPQGLTLTFGVERMMTSQPLVRPETIKGTPSTVHVQCRLFHCQALG